MTTDLLWKSLQHESLEAARLCPHSPGFRVDACILGATPAGLPFRVAYQILLNEQWETQQLTTQGYIGDRNVDVDLRRKAADWELNGRVEPSFAGCTEVDLPLTPFTNALPVNRLGLAVGESAAIRVIYFDLVEDETKPVSQCYTRLAENTYRYQNVPNDFEAVITVDAQGLVVRYPELFERLAAASW